MMKPDEPTNESPASHGEEREKPVNPPAKPKPQPPQGTGLDGFFDEMQWDQRHSS